MAFDGLFTKAIVFELQNLIDGRISKVHQPNEHEVIFTIRSKGKNHKLLISIHPSYSRVHLTEEVISNPKEPPMFCMVLRKHLEGGLITSLEQDQNDRIITISVKARDEIGDDIERKLVIEIMGRHSNLVMLNAEKNIIIDSLKHIPPSVNRYRTILPGQTYLTPPAQDKVNPYGLTEETFNQFMTTIETGRDFVKQLSGFSPVHGDELFARLKNEHPETQWSIFSSFLQSFQTAPLQAVLALKNERMVFSAIPLQYVDKIIKRFTSLGELLDTFYFERAKRERVRSQAADLERWLSNEITKLQTKVKKLQKELQSAEKLDKYQLYGELLTANSYQIQKGTTEAVVENYYEQGTTETISLDPKKNAIENAQRYFDKYRKAKNALIMIAEQLTITKDDIAYFEMVRQQVLQASPEDIGEIREELTELGYMRARGKQKKQKKKQPKPERYVSTSGIDISVGKNNKQNDYLTFKMANRSDIWLHTKDIPGSHVVIHHNEPDEQTLEEAAQLAAYFSKARDSSSVPVDYTVIKQVKKPSGAKPGFVIYFEQRSLFVTPTEEIVRKLAQNTQQKRK